MRRFRRCERKIQRQPGMASPFLPPPTQGHCMSDLNAAFEAAVANSKNLSERPRQRHAAQDLRAVQTGTAGDNTEKKPGFFRHGGPAPSGTPGTTCKGTEDDAKQQYIDLIQIP